MAFYVALESWRSNHGVLRILAFYESWRSMLRWNHGALPCSTSVCSIPMRKSNLPMFCCVCAHRLASTGWRSWFSMYLFLLWVDTWCVVQLYAPASRIWARTVCASTSCGLTCWCVVQQYAPASRIWARTVCASTGMGWLAGAWCNCMPLPQGPERELYVHLPVMGWLAAAWCNYMPLPLKPERITCALITETGSFLSKRVGVCIRQHMCTYCWDGFLPKQMCGCAA
jgi:hypothetical protein